MLLREYIQQEVSKAPINTKEGIEMLNRDIVDVDTHDRYYGGSLAYVFIEDVHTNLEFVKAVEKTIYCRRIENEPTKE